VPDNSLAYVDPDYQDTPLSARPAWWNNPVGTEYAGPGMGMQRGPFDPIAAMTPQGPMMQSQLDATHAQLQQAMQDVPGMVMGMAGGAPVGRWPSALVDVGETTAHVNPSMGDLARMMEAAPNHHLRALHEGPNVAVWPAYDATHAQMTAPLGFTRDAASLDYRGRVGEPDADFSNRAGRFSFMAVGRH
jgi:hypothetical protein